LAFYDKQTVNPVNDMVSIAPFFLAGTSFFADRGCLPYRERQMPYHNRLCAPLQTIFVK